MSFKINRLKINTKQFRMFQNIEGPTYVSNTSRNQGLKRPLEFWKVQIVQKAPEIQRAIEAKEKWKSFAFDTFEAFFPLEF